MAGSAVRMTLIKNLMSARLAASPQVDYSQNQTRCGKTVRWRLPRASLSLHIFNAPNPVIEIIKIGHFPSN